jgi:hypothetical protein
MDFSDNTDYTYGLSWKCQIGVSTMIFTKTEIVCFMELVTTICPQRTGSIGASYVEATDLKRGRFVGIPGVQLV